MRLKHEGAAEGAFRVLALFANVSRKVANVRGLLFYGVVSRRG